MKMFRKDEGFTLVELMVVVLIIGILVAIAIPVFLNASKNAATKSCQANQRTIAGAIQTYNATNGSQLQLTVKAGEVLAAQLSSELKAAPTCPTTELGYWLTQDANGLNAPEVAGDGGNGGVKPFAAGATWFTDHEL